MVESPPAPQYRCVQNADFRKEVHVQRRVIFGSLIVFVAAAAVSLLLPHELPAGGTSSPPRSDPAAFVSGVVRLIVADDYTAAWTSLNPAHKRVAPRREYVECERRSPLQSRLRSVEVIRVANRLMRIPGASRSVRAKAVTLRLTVEDVALRATETFKVTFNAVAEGSAWTWILTPTRYALYRDDACY
jgi:hypothetical protein